MPDSPPEEKQPKEENIWRLIGRYSNLAFVLPAAIIAGLVIGHLLDRWLGKTWITLGRPFCRLHCGLCGADSRDHPVEQGFMTTPPEDSSPDQESDPEILNQAPVDPAMEQRLSGAYGRILRVAIALSVAGTLVAALLFTWQSGLGLAIGSLLAYINFVWLHRGTERLVERIIASNKTTTADESKPRKVRFSVPLSFALRSPDRGGLCYIKKLSKAAHWLHSGPHSADSGCNG